METVRRTFQLAHVMKAWRGRRAGWTTRAARRARRRDRRTSASCATWPRSRSSRRSPTASPTTSARCAPGRLADIVLWKPAYFGVKPELVLKGGLRRPGRRSARATRPSSAPSRRATGPTGAAAAEPPRACSAHVRVRAGRGGPGAPDPARGGPDGRSWPCAGTRGLTRDSLARNRATAPIEIDPTDGRVTLAGRPLAVDPVSARCRSAGAIPALIRRPNPRSQRNRWPLSCGRCTASTRTKRRTLISASCTTSWFDWHSRRALALPRRPCCGDHWV